jgi:hypothetical protein
VGKGGQFPNYCLRRKGLYTPCSSCLIKRTVLKFESPRLEQSIQIVPKKCYVVEDEIEGLGCC